MFKEILVSLHLCHIHFLPLLEVMKINSREKRGPKCHAGGITYSHQNSTVLW